MMPWLWNWSPQLNYPLSGSVTQDFFSSINPSAGIGYIEKQIFDVASYGRQLGLITEVLLAREGTRSVAPEKAAKSLADLEALHERIEAVKAANKASLADMAAELLKKLDEADPEALARVLRPYNRPLE